MLASRKAVACWMMGELLPSIRAAASVAASTPFDIGKGLSIHAQSPLTVQVKHRSTGDMCVELSGADVSRRFMLHAGDHGISGTEGRPTQEPAELIATIPERYCPVFVKTQGGSVTLPGLTETSLDILTEGDGDVNVGKVKTNSASIRTQRGAIKGSITSTDINVVATGGPMTLKRVAGRTAHLSSSGGGISIDVLQVATGVVDSEGGDITIKQVTPYAGETEETEEGAHSVQVRSGGGKISIEGLDGSLSIDSGGGEVVLQCTQNMKHGTVRSHGGNITAYGQPGMQIQLHAVGGNGVKVQEGCDITGPHSHQTPFMVQGLLQTHEDHARGHDVGTRSSGEEVVAQEREGSSLARSERGEPPGCGGAVVDHPVLVAVAGDGAVNVLIRSWRESLLQRFSAQRASA